MRKTLLAGATVGLMAMTLPGLANAQSAERPHRMQRADANADVQISREQFVGRRLERLRAADANNDGQVTREELQAAGQARRAERVAARFDRLDADSNGSISRAEFEAPRQSAGSQRADGPRAAHSRAGRGGHHRGPRGQHVARRTGGEAGQPVVIGTVEARLNEAFARLDTDNNGQLTREEMRAGRAAMREQRGDREHRRGPRHSRGAETPSPQTPASE